jgi:hypothetical protein
MPMPLHSMLSKDSIQVETCKMQALMEYTDFLTGCKVAKRMSGVGVPLKAREGSHQDSSS